MRAKRIDKNQTEIIDHLRKHGCEVVSIGQPLDLIATNNGRWVLVEIKRLDKAVKRSQIKFMSQTRGFVNVATNSEEAYKLISLPGLYSLSQKQKDKLAGWLIKNPLKKTLSVKKFREVIK